MNLMYLTEDHDGGRMCRHSGAIPHDDTSFIRFGSKHSEQRGLLALEFCLCTYFFYPLGRY